MEEVKQITEQIPEKNIKLINEAITKKQQLVQAFYQFSVQLISLQKLQHETLDKLNNAGEGVKSRIDEVYNKMKIKNKNLYNWHYDEKNSMIGIVKPIKKEINESKKEN